MKEAILALVCFAIAGCATFDAEQDQALEMQTYQLNSLKADVARLKEQVAAIERTQQEIYRRLDQGEAGDRAEVRQLKTSVAQLEQGLQALDSARNRDRQEIIDTLGKRVADLMNSQIPSGRASSSTSGKERGVEHTVEAGQTISEIAAAYKVSVAKILKANNITNPKNIRVGQKLFIPE